MTKTAHILEKIAKKKKSKKKPTFFQNMKSTYSHPGFGGLAGLNLGSGLGGALGAVIGSRFKVKSPRLSERHGPNWDAIEKGLYTGGIIGGVAGTVGGVKVWPRLMGPKVENNEGVKTASKSDYLLEKISKKQERTETPLKGKTVYKAGDETSEKKKIVEQVANQHTVQDWKRKYITDDWKNSTVTADTTFTPHGGIQNVRHKVKRDSWLPSMFAPEYQTVRDRNSGLMNIETHNDLVRQDPNPPVDDLFPPEGLSKKKMIKNLKKTGELIIWDSFDNEMNKEASVKAVVKAVKRVAKMFNKKNRKKAQKWAKKRSLGGKFTTKGKPRRTKKGRPKKSGLNVAQKAVGKLTYQGKKWFKNPLKAMKHDIFSARHKRVSPKKVKGGKYKTIFGNKRKVVGYKGKNPYIKKTKVGQAAGVAFSVPGFAAMEAGLGDRKTSSGEDRGIGRRTTRGLLEGLAFKATPVLAMAGLMGSEMNKIRKQKKMDSENTALTAGKAIGRQIA